MAICPTKSGLGGHGAVLVGFQPMICMGVIVGGGWYAAAVYCINLHLGRSYSAYAGDPMWP